MRRYRTERAKKYISEKVCQQKISNVIPRKKNMSNVLLTVYEGAALGAATCLTAESLLRKFKSEASLLHHLPVSLQNVCEECLQRLLSKDKISVVSHAVLLYCIHKLIVRGLSTCKKIEFPFVVSLLKLALLCSSPRSFGQRNAFPPGYFEESSWHVRTCFRGVLEDRVAARRHAHERHEKDGRASARASSFWRTARRAP